MEFFELLRTHLAMCGVAITQKSAKNYPFINLKNSTVFILVCVAVGLIALSLNEANTYKDYTDILFQSVSIGVCGIVYAIVVWKTSKLFEFICSLADTVHESE